MVKIIKVSEVQTVPYQIFISYRRDGGEGLARLLEYKLTDRGFKVFFDVESLRSGAFNTELFQRIDECTDVVVVLPPNGLDRCKNPDDWVRLEIAHALQRNKNVIPIMMRNFKFPDVLPDDINDLRFMTGIEASNEYFSASIDRLVNKFLHSKPFNSNEYLLKEADNGNFSAMNMMGVRYELGLDSLLKDLKKAAEFYKKSATAGDIDAIYNLGDVYERCARDVSLIYEYDMDLPDLPDNHDDASKMLYKLAVDCYTKVANLNFAPAIYRLGNFEEEAKNFEKAFEYYTKAADLGYPAAQNALGYYKMHGIGTTIDQDSAVDCYRKAAIAGYTPAYYNYAQIVDKNNVEISIKMYEELIHLNPIPKFILPLANLYEKLLGDWKKAIAYYRLAYEKGSKEAKEGLLRCQDKIFGKKQNL